MFIIPSLPIVFLIMNPLIIINQLIVDQYWLIMDWLFLTTNHGLIIIDH